MLRDPLILDRLYRDPVHTIYWSDEWDPDFYLGLARAGFICIAFEHPDLGPLLIPEMQSDYAILDWPDLRCSRSLQRLLRSDRLAAEGVELRVTGDPGPVLERLRAYHPETWILDRYEALVRELPSRDDPGFAIRSVELWSRRREALVAGELGYTVGRSYTSLSGFCNRDDPGLRHFGTLQLYLLASRLRDCGYDFWNLGQTQQDYKLALGARAVPRAAFLARWMETRDREPAAALGDGGR